MDDGSMKKLSSTLTTRKIKPHEMRTVILLFVLTFIVLPLLPNRTVDPWQLFNPRNFGILVTTIAAIQFGGYLAIHLFGERFGMALTGFFGGLVSSTALFATLSEMLVAYPSFILATMASAIFATVAMLVDIIIIIFVASPSFLYFILWPMVAMLLIGMIIALILLHYQQIKRHTYSTLANPLNLLSVLRTSLFIGLTLILIAMAKRYFGTNGILLISFLAGIFEIHGITLATALLYLDNKVTINDARLALYLAIAASFVSKFFLLWTLTPYRFALQTSLCLLALLASGALVYGLGF
jgi:uncharacterized membrane protein (DUF4010 family)